MVPNPHGGSLKKIRISELFKMSLALLINKTSRKQSTEMVSNYVSD